ncbi:hypothetical protein VM98_29595, partial [Streptomyces rubellomurinus subsp. indigoferus]
MNRSSRSPFRNDSRRNDSRRSADRGGRHGSAARGEFAIPVSTTPALPAVESFAELDMPKALLSV